VSSGGFLVPAKRTAAQDILRRRGYHGLHLSDCSLSGSYPSGGAPTVLTRTSGLIYFSDFTAADGALTGFDSWTAPQGTWTIFSNQAKLTSNGSFDRAMRLTPTSTAMVIETRCQYPAGYLGHAIMALDGSNYWQSIIAATDRQFRSIVAGSDVGGLQNSGGNGTAANTWFQWKTAFAVGKLLAQYVNRAALLGPNFNDSGQAGNSAASGFGLVCYQAQNTLFDSIAVYKSTILSMDGLSGSMAWRLMDASNTQIAASPTQSAGVASKEIGNLIDCPFTGYVELHTSTAFTSLLKRYPSTGNATDIYGGDVYHN
jgi:hypothetical protein